MQFSYRTSLPKPDHVGSEIRGWPRHCDPLPLFLSLCSIWSALQIWFWPRDFLETCAAGTLATQGPGQDVTP